MKLDIFNFFRNVQEKFEVFFLSAIFGLIYLRLFLLYRPIASQSQIINFYVVAWIFFPLLGLLTTYLLERIRRGINTPSQKLYPILLFLNFLLGLWLLHPVWGHQWEWKTYLRLFAALQIMGFFKIWKTLLKHPNWLQGGMFLSALAWLLSLIHPWAEVAQWNFLNIVLFLMLFYALFYGSNPKAYKGPILTLAFPKLQKWIPFLTYLVVLFSLIWIVMDPAITLDKGGMSFYMGPLADMKGGKSLLFNINHQYGVLNFYFLNFFFTFLPLGFQTLGLVLTLLTVAQYFILYFIARQLFKKESAALMCLVMVLALNFFGTRYYWGPYLTPSVGPLRFGFIYVLMALVLLRPKLHRFQTLLYFLEAATSAIAFFWSFEVCVYTIPAFVAFLVFESIQVGKRLGFNWRLYLKRMVLFFFALVLVDGYIYLDVFLRTQSLPHWSFYFDYIRVYKEGLGAEPTPPVYYWWIFMAIYYFSFFGLVQHLLSGSEQKDFKFPLGAIALLTFYGITQFIYYLGRSHWNNLFHIDMPCVVLFLFWFYHLRSESSKEFPKRFKIGLLAAAAFFSSVYLSQPLLEILNYLQLRPLTLSQIYQGIISESKDLPKDESLKFAQSADALMNHYSPGQKSLVYFLGSGGLAVSLYTHRVNVYPYNDVGQIFFCPPVLDRVKAFNPTLNPGDYVYLSEPNNFFGTDPNASNFEKDLWEKLQKRYLLNLVETKESISVYQVIKPL